MDLLSFTLALLSGFLVALVAVAGLRLRGRIRRRVGRSVPQVDDRAIRDILEQGVLRDDDPPLDAREIEEEERRFWSERWDEPEEL